VGLVFAVEEEGWNGCGSSLGFASLCVGSEKVLRRTGGRGVFSHMITVLFLDRTHSFASVEAGGEPALRGGR